MRKLLGHLRYRRSQRERRKRLWELDPSRGDSDRAINLEADSDSHTLLLAFGGMNQRIGNVPPFEFLSLTGEIAVKRVFVRDLRQAWYHRGIPGAGHTLASVTDALRRLVDEQRAERLIVAGGSAGGYAALVFGSLLGADVVLSFTPQTILDLDELAAFGDHRWDGHLKPLVTRGELDPEWVDLRQALPAARIGDTRYEVFVDDTLATDRSHAERLLGLDGLRLYRFGAGSHALVRSLRDCGALERILRRALRAHDPAGASGA